jgi:uncharacterized protein with FMN-binding domain
MRRVALAIVSTIAGLVGLLTFKTHATTLSGTPAAVSTAGTAAGSTSTGTSSGTSAAATPSSTGTSSTSTSTPATTTKMVTGDSIDTRWGPVQVKITVTGGKLAAVDAVVYPMNNGRDQEINAYAIPALTKEALAAGSAKIDTISGATYTSTGYINSLQSALDKAGLS